MVIFSILESAARISLSKSKSFGHILYTLIRRIVGKELSEPSPWKMGHLVRPWVLRYRSSGRLTVYFDLQFGLGLHLALGPRLSQLLALVGSWCDFGAQYVLLDELAQLAFKIGSGNAAPHDLQERYLLLSKTIDVMRNIQDQILAQTGHHVFSLKTAHARIENGVLNEAQRGLFTKHSPIS